MQAIQGGNNFGKPEWTFKTTNESPVLLVVVSTFIFFSCDPVKVSLLIKFLEEKLITIVFLLGRSMFRWLRDFRESPSLYSRGIKDRRAGVHQRELGSGILIPPSFFQVKILSIPKYHTLRDCFLSLQHSIKNKTGINLAKEMKSSTLKNHRTLLIEMKEDLI